MSTCRVAVFCCILSLSIVHLESACAEEQDTELELVELAKSRFGKLSEAETRLFRSIAVGEDANYTALSQQQDPALSEEWPESRVIQADRIAWLCTDTGALSLITSQGVAVVGARLEGQLNLRFAEVPFPLYFEACDLPGGLQITGASLKLLFLPASRVTSIIAHICRVAGNVFLGKGFRASDRVDFTRAKIGGILFCSGAHLSSKSGRALIADRITVEKSVLLDAGFEADGEVYLRGARISQDLRCSGGSFRNARGVAIVADGCRIGGDVVFGEGFSATGEVRLASATINRLEGVGCEFSNPGGVALNAERLTTSGDVTFKGGCSFRGEVRLSWATISGTLSCDAASFHCSAGPALGAEGTTVVGNVFFRDGCKVTGCLRFLGANIHGSLECDGARFKNPNARTFNGENLAVRKNVFLRRGFLSDGEVYLLGASIGGTLECDGSAITNSRGCTLNAERLSLAGDMFLREGFTSVGRASLIAARIGGNLDCTDARFSNPGGRALNAERINVDGDVFLRRGFASRGEVWFLGAKIHGQLDCETASFRNSRGIALLADGMLVEGNVFLRTGFLAEGQVRFFGSDVRGEFDCSNGTFRNPGGIALSGESLNVRGSVRLADGFGFSGEVKFLRSRIGGLLLWRKVRIGDRASLDLRFAQIGYLCDEAGSWPPAGGLSLDGLVYDDIIGGPEAGSSMRVDWLRRQGDFRPQPYEQLASVLRRRGQNLEAEAVLIAREKDRARMTSLGVGSWIWFRLLGPIIGYGYRPEGVAWPSIGIILLGWVLYQRACRGDPGGRESLIVPVSSDAYDGHGSSVSERYPRFSALAYSLDSFVPLLNLQQCAFWIPNANRGHHRSLAPLGLTVGSLIRVYMWFQIVAGWILTTLLAIGLTGIVRG